MVSEIKSGNLAIAVRKIKGMVDSHEIGTVLRVLRIYDNECTIELPEGGGCMVGVPLRFLGPIE